MSDDRPWFLVSLYDKEPYADWLRAVDATDQYRWVATGGTADWCAEKGVECTSVDELVGLSSRLGGKVKTLHPDLYTGIMAEEPGELPDGIPFVRGVLVDLTPFEMEGEFRPGKIDIGGPSLLRAGVKSCEHVVVLSDPDSARLHRDNLPADAELRRRLARRTLRGTLRYDKELLARLDPEGTGTSERTTRLSLIPGETLRYGENPDQAGWITRDLFGDRAPSYTRLHGKGLSYTNCLDVEAARRMSGLGEDPQAVVIKHTNPTGWAAAEGLSTAIDRAWEGDPKSAFGSVVGVNRPVDGVVLDALEDRFVEALVAPAFEEAALDRLRGSGDERPRALRWDGEWDWLPPQVVRAFGDGYLCQGTPDPSSEEDREVVSERTPEAPARQALNQMWRLCRWVTSNAAVVGTRGRALGVGAGQQSRVDAVQLALEKAEAFHAPLPDPLILASDGFFPFPDNVEIAAEHGVDALVAPGGSVRDEEVIEAANRLGVALIFTESRIFYH